MISLDRVVIRYPRDPRAAVDGVSFDVAPGRVTALVGPNGSGKSTIVRALLGRVPVAGGRITIGGADLASLARRDAARAVAVVPQREEPVFPRDVRDFVALGRHAHLGPWGALTADDRAAVDSAIARAGVEEFAGRTTDELSGGEWQRVRLARALAQDAPALVLDEPNSYLDVAHELALFEVHDGVARAGTAVLVISHQLNLVARFASHLVLLSHGRVAAQGDAGDVMRGDLLEAVYGWPIVVSRDPAVGAPMLVPMRRRGPGSAR